MHKVTFFIIILCLLPHCAYKQSSSQATKKTDKDGLMTSSTTQESEDKGPRSLWHRAKEWHRASKTLSHKGYDELKEKLEEYMQIGDSYMALKYAEKMYAQCDKIEELCDLLLVCADMCFAQQNYKKASTLYNDFVRLYPGIPQKTEYAWFRVIVCSFEQQTATTDRDQTVTHETITLAQNFLKQELFATHKKAVEDLLARSYQKVVDHELGIIDFYMYKGSTIAAAKCLENMKKSLLPVFAASEPLILVQEVRIAHAQHNAEHLRTKIEELNMKFPDLAKSTYVAHLPYMKVILQDASLVIAQAGQSSSSNFANRF